MPSIKYSNGLIARWGKLTRDDEASLYSKMSDVNAVMSHHHPAQDQPQKVWREPPQEE